MIFSHGMVKSLLHTWRFIGRHPLASRNKREAFLRWLRWQVGARILARPVVMPFVGEAVLVVEPGMTGATGNIYCGLHEFADMAFVLHYLRRGDLFADIGANIGSYSVLAAKVAGANVIAVEPVLETFVRLQRNLRMNFLEEKVEVYQCAVGNASGVIRFTADQDTTNRVVQGGYAGRSIEVPVNTLDGILARRSTIMWKIDVEGFEREVLAGAANALRDEHLNVVLLESDDDQLRCAMTAAGFQRTMYDPFRRDLRLADGRASAGNNLWVRNISIVQAQCQAAPKHEILGVEF